MTPERADLWFRLHGLFDAIFRLSIPLIFRFHSMDIIYIFPTSVFTGIIVLTLTAGLLYTSLKALAIVPIICKFDRHRRNVSFDVRFQYSVLLRRWSPLCSTPSRAGFSMRNIPNKVIFITLSSLVSARCSAR